MNSGGHLAAVIILGAQLVPFCMIETTMFSNNKRKRFTNIRHALELSPTHYSGAVRLTGLLHHEQSSEAMMQPLQVVCA